MIRTVLTLFIVLAWAGAEAQDTANTIKNSSLDLSVPESPAFTVLGLTPSTVTRPASPRALASSLLNGVDQNGNFQTGVAIDTAPYMLFYGNQVTLSQYRSSKTIRALARTQLSLATTKGASDADKSAKLAAGLNFTIFDKGDPRSNRDYLNSLVNAAQDAMNSFPPLGANDSADQRKKDVEAKVEQSAKAIREQFQKQSWNRSSWSLAAASSWISKDGSSSNIAPDGSAVWTSLAYGFENIPGLQDSAQVIIHARFHSSENVPDPQKSGSFYRQQSEVAGGRVRFGTNTTVGSFEGVYVHTRPVGRPTDRFLRLTFGAEKQISDNLWLHFGIGGESGVKNGNNKLLVLSSFQWGTGPK